MGPQWEDLPRQTIELDTRLVNTHPAKDHLGGNYSTCRNVTTISMWAQGLHDLKQLMVFYLGVVD